MPAGGDVVAGDCHLANTAIVEQTGRTAQHPLQVMAMQSISLLYQFWIHTEAIDKMPRWFEAVMNTPSHHRVHHATNPRYLDRNYAGVFIVWDRLYGTFQAFAVLVAVFVGAGLVRKEIDKRTLYTLLSKPIHRSQFVLGKYLGMLLILVVEIAVLVAVWYLILLGKGVDVSAEFGKALLLVFMEVMVITAMA